MASPQKENGHTQISNELLEALSRVPSLGSEAFQVLMCVIRYSYGFHRKDAELSASFIAKGTGMQKRNVSRAISRLLSKRMIARSGSTIKFEKNYDVWLVSKRTWGVQTDRGGVSKRTEEVLSKRTDKKDNSKYNLNKDTLSKDKDAPRRREKKSNPYGLLPGEAMSNIDDRDRSFPRTRTFGSEKIDWTLDYLEFKLGRKLTGKENWNRIYAGHMANKYGMGKTRRLIEWIATPENWWFDKVSQMGTVYKNADRLFAQMESKASSANLIVAKKD